MSSTSIKVFIYEGTKEYENILRPGGDCPVRIFKDRSPQNTTTWPVLFQSLYNNMLHQVLCKLHHSLQLCLIATKTPQINKVPKLP